MITSSSSRSSSPSEKDIENHVQGEILSAETRYF